MKTLLPLCFLVSFLCGSVLPCFGGMGGGRWIAPRFYSSELAPAVNPLADGTGVLYGNGFQSSPLGPAPAPVDYGLNLAENFMRAQGGCIHSCGWGKKK